MEELKTLQEIVHEGWLIKSPPTKLWRARWRKRWFALRDSGELPGQYFLEYYTDRRCRKLKGRIDLDQCQQVDAGLRFENRKQKYQFMFNVKTPKRIYYLVAESEADMNKWVNAVCQVCELKAYTQDEEQHCQMFQYETQESPPISPTSTISGPYIPISECISGRRLNDASSLCSGMGQGPDHYDAPRKLAPSPPRSPTTTDVDSVFTDDEWTTPVPSVNWETFPSGEPRAAIGSGGGTGEPEVGSWRVQKRFGKLTLVDSTSRKSGSHDSINAVLPAPPRPPKPPHMLDANPGHNYLNLDGATESSKPTTPATPGPLSTGTSGSGLPVDDETYDFPRSHQPGPNSSESNGPRHCYSNAAPTTISGCPDDRIFRYDFPETDGDSGQQQQQQQHVPSSPRSESSATATYSNLPSPHIRHSPVNHPSPLQFPVPANSSPGPTSSSSPPIVYRQLKPGRKASDSTSIVSNEPSPGPVLSIPEVGSPGENSPAAGPPSIDRKLKPALGPKSTGPPAINATEGPLRLASPPGRTRPRAAPSPTPPTTSNRHSNSDEDNNPLDDKEEIYYYQDHSTFIPASNRRLVVLQYLDLDLEASESFAAAAIPPAQSPPNTTVYKTVDFLKTEAFNRTRQLVEEERNKSTDELS